jgi:hypothetical protein
MNFHNIRHKRMRAIVSLDRQLLEDAQLRRICCGLNGSGTSFVYFSAKEQFLIDFVISQLLTGRKLRIAVLTLATFIALC